VGERLLLVVDGEPALSDTFLVKPGPQIVLPGIGPVPLAGVGRDSVAPYLKTCLARYVRAAPSVHVTILMRVAVLGEVERPGFYAVSSDQPLADVMMRAGGPTKDALVPDIRVERGDRRLLAGDKLATAMTSGATVGAAGIVSGDRIVVPRMDRADPESKFRIISILVALPVAAYGVVQLFK
jgi:protein involved in polysaccharide export with SLBB domain